MVPPSTFLTVTLTPPAFAFWAKIVAPSTITRVGRLGDQLDREPVLARPPEQRSRLVRVVPPLREVVTRVRRIEGRVDVVADAPESGETLPHHLRPVNE